MTTFLTPSRDDIYVLLRQGGLEHASFRGREAPDFRGGSASGLRRRRSGGMKLGGSRSCSVAPDALEKAFHGESGVGDASTPVHPSAGGNGRGLVPPGG